MMSPHGFTTARELRSHWGKDFARLGILLSTHETVNIFAELRGGDHDVELHID
jgi:hypothetical protein